MQPIFRLAIVAAMIVATCTHPRSAAAEPPQRVGGDLEARTELKVDAYRSGDCAVTEALPRGYPAPTPPGAIDLKRYPVVRRAEVAGHGSADAGTSRAFFPLLAHIQERGIEMTAPVEIDLGEAPDGASTWTMAFLYRTPDLGPTGPSGGIDVVDTEPVTVISVGLRGPYGAPTVERGLAAIRGWLEGQSDWTATGDPRVLYYNGPYVPDARKWSEVQIPVQPAAVAAETPPAGIAPSDEALAGLIERAVARGSRLFNDRAPEACAAVYEVTVEALLLLDSGRLQEQTRSRLERTVARGPESMDAHDRAWALRRVLDAAWAELRRTGRPAES